MSHELHYTSAARGLRSGSVGYCTVGATANLPGPLAVRLEGLSAYRAVYPKGHPSADLNPCVISHAKLSIAGMTYNVVSRISDAGLDYSGRDNKYAHHVAIEPHERPEAGPAWLASRPEFLESSWSGEPGTVENKEVPKGDWPPRKSERWAEWFLDEGWAGAVAESFLADPNRPIFIVFDPGQDVLPLFVEAMALLPKDRRWDVGFSTYYTGQSQGLACPWRGVLRGSPEEQQARRLPNAIVLDPRRPPGLAEGGALVEQARTGIAPPLAERTAPSGPVRFTAPARVELRPEAHRVVEGPAETPARRRPTAADPLEARSARKPPAPRTAEAELRQKILYAGAGLAVTLVMGGVVAVAAWAYSARTDNRDADDPVIAVVDQINRKIDEKSFDEAKDIASKHANDPRFVENPRFVKVRAKLEDAEHDARFLPEIDRLTNADITLEEPEQLGTVRSLARKGVKDQKAIEKALETRKIKREQRIKSLTREFESRLGREEFREAEVTLAGIEPYFARSVAPSPMDGLRRQLREKERAALFREAIRTARLEFQDLAARGWRPHPSSSISFLTASMTVSNESERRQVEDLRRQYFASPGPVDRPSTISSSIPEGSVVEKSFTRANISESRLNPPLPPTPVAFESLPKSENAEERRSTDGGATTWRLRSEKEVRSIQILGLSAAAPARWKISAIPQGEPPNLSVLLNAEVAGGRVILGTFRSKTRSVAFEVGPRALTEAREAFQALEGCLMEIQYDKPEPPARCLIRPSRNPAGSRIALASLFNPKDIDTDGRNDTPKAALRLKLDLGATRGLATSRPSLNQGLLLRGGPGELVKLEMKGDKLTGEYEIKSTKEKVHVDVEIKESNPSKTDDRSYQLVILIRPWRSQDMRRNDLLLKLPDARQGDQGAAPFDAFDRDLQDQIKALEPAPAESRGTGTMPPSVANQGDAGRRSSNPEKDRLLFIQEYLRLLYRGSIELSPGLRADERTFYLIKSETNN